MATAPEPLTFSALAVEVLRAWREAGRYVEAAQDIYLDAAVTRWLTGLLRGPFPGTGTEEDLLLKRLTGR